MGKVTLTETTNKLFQLLEPLEPGDRHKVIEATLTLLGEERTVGETGTLGQGANFSGIGGGKALYELLRRLRITSIRKTLKRRLRSSPLQLAS